MKRFRNAVLLFLLLALAACKPDRSGQPVAATSTPAPVSSPAATQPGDKPSLPDQRPTTAPVDSLAANFPVFDGLYWTSEVSVVMSDDQAVRLTSPLPCSNLLSLLSSGEWRLTQKAIPGPSQIGMISTLGLLERGDQAAWVDIRDLQAAPVSLDGTPVPTPTPTTEPAPGQIPDLTGCRGIVQIVPQQTISASGEEEVEGQARQYPYYNGCTKVEDSASVNLIYEGPGDFRSIVSLSIPLEVGEHPASVEDTNLQILHTDQSYIEMMQEYYQTMESSQSSDSSQAFADINGAEYSPAGDDAGIITVRSVDPLEGELNLTGLTTDEGTGEQSFHAAFRCPPFH